MNKATLAQTIADRLNIQKRLAEEMIAALQDLIIDTLKRGEEVTLAGFGTFSARVRHARRGVNPRKPSETIHVPAVTVPKFKAGKRLKDELKSRT